MGQKVAGYLKYMLLYCKAEAASSPGLPTFYFPMITAKTMPSSARLQLSICYPENREDDQLPWCNGAGSLCWYQH